MLPKPETTPSELCRRITVRVSPKAYVRLETVAGQTQRTVSDIVRHAVEGPAVRPRRQGREDGALIRQLIRVGCNLNQQTRLLHLFKHRGDLPDCEVLLAMLEELEGMLRAIHLHVRRPRE